MSRDTRRPDREVLLTPAEVAVRLRLSTRTVARLRASGDLRVTMLAGKVFYHPKDVDDYAYQRWSA